MATRLSLFVANRPGIIEAVTGVFSMKGVNIESLHVEPTNSEGTEGQMVFRVNTDASPELLQELSSIDGVISAE